MIKTLLAALFATCATAAFADELTAMPDVSVLPKEVVQISPVVPGMGEHWADPKTLPLGPIYCVYKGKVVCLEYMISQADFAAGKSWPTLTGLTDLPSINHLSVAFEPHGHEGFTVPHYDLHMYFLSPEQMAEVQPES
jgi:hypothetical protein